MTKLRLLITKACNRRCLGCCNNDWDLDSLEAVDSYVGYTEILLTGGEPMLDVSNVERVITDIRKKSMAFIYLYTAKVDNIKNFERIFLLIDGVTITLHEQKDVKPFVQMNKYLSPWKYGKSLRVNIFKGIDLKSCDYLNKWVVKDNIEWIKDCPLPKEEDFKIYQLV